MNSIEQAFTRLNERWLNHMYNHPLSLVVENKGQGLWYWVQYGDVHISPRLTQPSMLLWLQAYTLGFDTAKTGRRIDINDLP